jgi:AcrR family transcriptional regulator
MMARRPYRQTARAEATEALRRRIIGAFVECARERWFDEITLDEVGRRAGTTPQTVIRQFGGKDGLVAGLVQYVTPTVGARRTVSDGDVSAAIDRLFENYEQDGDMTIRALAQEPRYPALKPALDAGRAGHRAVAAANYARWLDALPEAERTIALDALVVVTDTYAWKLLRRDMGRSERDAEAVVAAMVEAILARFSSHNDGSP